MAVRPDARLDDAPLEPLTCSACRARVGVRKASWEQTSIQWQGDALAACLEHRATSRGAGPNGEVFRGCAALSRTITEAAVRGDVRVRDDSEPPCHTEVAPGGRR
jgi:hypothetical protein